jgi:hypothetical protein
MKGSPGAWRVWKYQALSSSWRILHYRPLVEQTGARLRLPNNPGCVSSPSARKTNPLFSQKSQ